MVGGFNPLKNMSSSVGMIIPNIYIYIYIWKNKHVPNHKSDIGNHPKKKKKLRFMLLMISVVHGV